MKYLLILFVLLCGCSREPLEQIMIKGKLTKRRFFHTYTTEFQWLEGAVLEKQDNLWKIRICDIDGCIIKWTDITDEDIEWKRIKGDNK